MSFKALIPWSIYLPLCPLAWIYGGDGDFPSVPQGFLLAVSRRYAISPPASHVLPQGPSDPQATLHSGCGYVTFGKLLCLSVPGFPREKTETAGGPPES